MILICSLLALIVKVDLLFYEFSAFQIALRKLHAYPKSAPDLTGLA